MFSTSLAKRQKLESIQSSETPDVDEIKLSKFEQQKESARIESIDVMPNGMSVSLESGINYVNSKAQPVSLFLHYQNSVQKLSVNNKMEHICVINDGKHILAYGEAKKAINVELWDLTVLKKVNSAKLKHANLERGSCIDIISTKNYILTHYSCNDLSAGREHRHLELRDIDTFTKLSNKKVYNLYDCFVSPYNSDSFFFTKSGGYEYWKIIDDSLNRICDVTIPNKDGSTSLGMLTDGKTLVTGHRWGAFRFWQLEENAENAEIKMIKHCPANRFYHADDVANIVVIPDGKHLVSWDNNAATLWDISDINKPNIINKIVVAPESLGYGPGILTDDWDVITRCKVIIRFPEIQAARELYKQEVARLIADKQHANMPVRSLDKIILDYCFFKPTLPVELPVVQESDDELEPETRGVKRKLEI